MKNWLLCVNNSGYSASLEPKKLYQSLEDTKADALNMVRVIDESGEDYLFPKKLFINLPKGFVQELDKVLHEPA